MMQEIGRGAQKIMRELGRVTVKGLTVKCLTWLLEMLEWQLAEKE